MAAAALLPAALLLAALLPAAQATPLPPLPTPLQQPVKPVKPKPLAVQAYFVAVPGPCFAAEDADCEAGAPIATPDADCGAGAPIATPDSEFRGQRANRSTPGTVDYMNYVNFPSPDTVLLYKGVACLKVCIMQPGFNIDHFVVLPAADAPPAAGPYGGVAVCFMQPGFNINHFVILQAADALPAAEPYGGVAPALPGVITGTLFDLGDNAMVAGVVPPNPPKASGYGVKASGYGVKVVPGPPGVRGDAPQVRTAACDTCPGGWAIEAAADGDFFSYTATLPKAGKYVVGANVGSASPLPKGNRVVVMAGAGECIERAAPYNCNPALEATAAVALDAAFTSTGGFAVFEMFMGDPIVLPAGDACLQLCALGAPVSVSNIDVWATYDPIKVTIPGVVEAENFDIGGPGVTFFETTPDNNGGNIGYRPDAPSIDVEFGNNADKVMSNDADLNWIDAGEWWRYTVMSNDADLNWIDAGEWWRYTVMAVTPQATYAAAMRAGRAAPTPEPGPMARVLTVPGACAATKPLDCAAKYNYGPRAKPADPALLLDVVYPDALAEGYYNYHSIVSGGDAVQMDAGPHCIQVCALQGDFHFDSLDLEQEEILATPAPTTPPAAAEPGSDGSGGSGGGAAADGSGGSTASSDLSTGAVVAIASASAAVGAVAVFGVTRLLALKGSKTVANNGVPEQQGMWPGDRASVLGATDAIDLLLRGRYGALLEDAQAGKLQAWADGPDACLALILLLDQFSRHIYRDSADRDALVARCDALALPLAEGALDKGWQWRLSAAQHAFLLMPLRHARPPRRERLQRVLDEVAAREAREERGATEVLRRFRRATVRRLQERGAAEVLRRFRRATVRRLQAREECGGDAAEVLHRFRRATVRRLQVREQRGAAEVMRRFRRATVRRLQELQGASAPDGGDDILERAAFDADESDMHKNKLVRAVDAFARARGLRAAPQPATATSGGGGGGKGKHTTHSSSSGASTATNGSAGGSGAAAGSGLGTTSGSTGASGVAGGSIDAAAHNGGGNGASVHASGDAAAHNGSGGGSGSSGSGGSSASGGSSSAANSIHGSVDAAVHDSGGGGSVRNGGGAHAAGSSTPVTMAISLSGGVDSMVLAKILHHLQPAYGWRLVAVHIDYANRAESGKEADFVEQCVHLDYANRVETGTEPTSCHSLSITFRKRVVSEVTRGVTDRAEYEAVSREAANASRMAVTDEDRRDARYAAYAEVLREFAPCPAILFGHHRGDVQENVVSNVMRGCSLLKVAGMGEESINSGVKVWRPLLAFDKDAIFDFAHRYSVPYFKDTTPLWSTRGKLRNGLVPLLKDMYGDGVLGHLSALAAGSDELASELRRELFQPFWDSVERCPMGASVDLMPYRGKGLYFWREALMVLLHSLGLPMALMVLLHSMGLPMALMVLLHSMGLPMVSDRALITTLRRLGEPNAPPPSAAWWPLRREYRCYCSEARIEGVLYILQPAAAPPEPYAVAAEGTEVEVSEPGPVVAADQLAAHKKGSRSSSSGRRRRRRGWLPELLPPPFADIRGFMSGAFSHTLPIPTSPPHDLRVAPPPLLRERNAQRPDAAAQRRAEAPLPFPFRGMDPCLRACAPLVSCARGQAALEGWGDAAGGGVRVVRVTYRYVGSAAASSADAAAGGDGAAAAASGSAAAASGSAAAAATSSAAAAVSDSEAATAADSEAAAASGGAAAAALAAAGHAV
ncbi:hypothetical protein JKP88DRAFT_350529 [Tribonema minus]|uniref:tRNA(Ile)-lysidine synthetase n=1 Tax=Tribonema minus TaxID=303371 RepID=A0A835YLZ2_9STRA|nr:hypothetical protein JKP88DRAFT_350529 [Tribonema minus]